MFELRFKINQISSFLYIDVLFKKKKKKEKEKIGEKKLYVQQPRK